MEDKIIPVYQKRGLQPQQNKEKQYFDSLSIFKDKPFWIEDKEQHKQQFNNTDGQCCFNHIIGLPINAEDKPTPIFDYEMLVVNAILEHRHVWIKKAAGLGITELILRYLAWACLSTNKLENKLIFIVSGTREKFANELKERMEKLFIQNFPNLKLDSKYTELLLNKTYFKVFPTEAIKDLRGHADVAYIFIDEADHFDTSGWTELPAAIKRYDQKSNCKFIFVSTPNIPGGLFDSIERGIMFKDWFHKLFLGYEWGVGKMYTPEFIEKEKGSADFEREYNLKYLGKIGNVFSSYDIDQAIKLGEQYKDLPINQYCLHIVGVDPGFSSSKTAVYMAEVLKEEKCIRIIYGREYDKDTPSKIADDIHTLHTRYLNFYCYVDGANRAFVNELKYRFGESTNWNKPEEVFPQSNRILPVNFATSHKSMLEHLHNLISKAKIAIPKEYELLITSLRTATAEEWNLKKDETVNSDSLDALRMLCIPIKFGVRQ
jgi:hypothetical protein